MKITQLYIYPIKSLNGISLSEAKVVDTGLEHDRLFTLLKIEEDGTHKNMNITRFTQMSLFRTSIKDDTITVSYSGPENSLPETLCTIPLCPDTNKLEMIDVNLHRSPVKAFDMGEEYSDWFSKQFGFKVKLAYIGQGRREVLGSIFPKPETTGLSSWLPSALTGKKGEVESSGLTFADCANFLVTTEESLKDVSARLPEGIEADMKKFRANIVVQGAKEAWDEDFWGEIKSESPNREAIEIPLTANCLRCTSLNIDYNTGKPGTGEDGTVLKKLMADRRVDKGNKYSPVFGRYGFLKKGGGSIIRVGDEFEVTKRISERDVWDWPGVGST